MGAFDSIGNVDKWFSDRWGKFTASCNYKLLSTGASGRLFGTGANSYIEEKAMEMTTNMWERPGLDQVESLLHGRVHEYPAYLYYLKATGNNSLIYMGDENPIFLDYEPLKGESGGTPDCGDINDKFQIDIGAEIKCPKNPIEHFRRLKWKDQWDVRENYISCYSQIQNLMMITGALQWDFISYDDRQVAYKNKGKIIEVKPDIKFQDNLDMRIRLAIKEKYKVLSEHLGIEVRDRQHLLQIQAA